MEAAPTSHIARTLVLFPAGGVASGIASGLEHVASGQSFWIDLPLEHSASRWYDSEQGTFGASLEIGEKDKEEIRGLLQQLIRDGRLPC